MLKGKIQDKGFIIDGKKIKSEDQGIKDLLTGLNMTVYDPHQGQRRAYIDAGDYDAYLILNDFCSAFGFKLEFEEYPDIGEEEHIKVIL